MSSLFHLWLALLVQINMRAKLCNSLGATDANQTMRGMCRVQVPYSARMDLYDRCKGQGEHAFLNLPYTASDMEVFKSSIDALAIMPLAWRDLVAFTSEVGTISTS